MDGGYSEKHQAQFHTLLGFLARIPAIRTNDSPWGGFGSGESKDGLWWVKLSIDVRHPLAWLTVQEMGHVLNLLSIEERLPTVFKPVSPPPYVNGGPEDYLSWVIEATAPMQRQDRSQSGWRAGSPSLSMIWLNGLATAKRLQTQSASFIISQEKNPSHG